MSDHLIVGKIGEDIACEYLINRGFRILIRNYREKYGEIDIIAKAVDKTLIFFEVKTLMKKSDFEMAFIPEDNLTESKLKKVVRISNVFSAKHPTLVDEEKGWRIDLLAIILNSDGIAISINHYENIAT